MSNENSDTTREMLNNWHKYCNLVKYEEIKCLKELTTRLFHFVQFSTLRAFIHLAVCFNPRQIWKNLKVRALFKIHQILVLFSYN